jgi:hypothetical protein
MDIVYKKRAANAISKVAYFIENNNTEGSGLRWFDVLDNRINSFARTNAKLLCGNKSLKQYLYYCFNFKGWIIAYRISANKFEVCRFIWGGRLK